MPERYACSVCDRTDLSVTANDWIRSHAANGKRPSPDNPACGGSGEVPRGYYDEPAGLGPNPYRAPLPDHTHRYEYADDGNGHSGSFCSVCGGPEPEETVQPDIGPTREQTRAAIEALKRRTPEQKLATAMRMDRTASAALGLPLDPDLPHDRQPELGKCTRCGEPRNGHAHDIPMEEPWNKTPSTPPTTTKAPGSPSKPVSTASVAPAGATSTRATQSPGTETTLSTRTAPTTETVTDAFESAAPTAKQDNEPKRDRWGRYLLPNPVTGKRQAWTRATTMAKSISDTFALSQWSQRMVAKGFALRPDLIALASTLDVKSDKDRLNSIVEQAKDAAGQKVSANLGTAVHSFTEAVDAGASLDSVPAPHRPDVAAYLAAMKEAGLVSIPHLIERITVVQQFDTAGTFDRINRTADGDHVIGDVKTGRTLEYGWQEIAIQLALYAHGVNDAGVYDMAGEAWQTAPKVRTDYGIVMHLPVGEATCTLYRVDLEQGWAAAQLCADVRSWRKTRNLAEPYAVAEYTEPPVPAQLSVRPPTWAERFSAISSRGEAADLYNEALKELGYGDELSALAKVGMTQLASLEERAG